MNRPILVVGDLHLAATPPGRRDDRYLEDAKAKLDQIADFVTVYNVGVVVLIGDIFHAKRANRVPYSLVTWLMGWMGTLGAEVVIIPGNHDLADGTLESISRQPIAALTFLPNVRLLGADPDNLYSDSTVAEGWVLHGIAGTAAVTDARVPMAELLGGADEFTDVVFLHAPVSTRELPWPTYNAAQLQMCLPPNNSVRYLVYGHQHDQAGMVLPAAQLPSGERFPGVLATGAVMRGSIHEANNPPAVILLERNGTPSLLPLKVRPAGEVYRWAELAAEKADDAATTAFVNAIGTEQLAGFSAEGLIGQIRSRPDLADDVKAMAIEILEQ